MHAKFIAMLADHIPLLVKCMLAFAGQELHGLLATQLAVLLLTTTATCSSQCAEGFVRECFIIASIEAYHSKLQLYMHFMTWQPLPMLRLSMHSRVTSGTWSRCGQ